MITGTGRRVCIVVVSVIWPDSDSWLEPAQLPGGPDHAPDDVPDTSIVKTPFSDFATAAAGAISAPAHSTISRRRISGAPRAWRPGGS